MQLLVLFRPENLAHEIIRRRPLNFVKVSKGQSVEGSDRRIRSLGSVCAFHSAQLGRRSRTAARSSTLGGDE